MISLMDEAWTYLSLNLERKSSDLEYTDIELISDEFIYSFSNRVLILNYLMTVT